MSIYSYCTILAVSIMYVSSSYESAFAKKDKDDEDKKGKR